MDDKSRNVVGDGVTARTDEVGWLSVGVHVYIRIFIVALLLWCLFHRPINGIVHQWLTDASWSHGFLIPLFSLYFLNQRRDEILRVRARPNYLGLIGLLCCVTFYFLDTVYFEIGYFKPLVVVATVGVMVLFLGGGGMVMLKWLPIAYLVFAIPLPGRFYRQLTIPLRELAAWIAAGILNLVPNMQATAGGVVIDVVYKGIRMEPALDVAEACSGMRLLMAFLALGVAMAYLHFRPISHRIVLLASTVPIAIVCNVVRVTVTGFIYILWDPKYAHGIYHDMLGMLMLPLAFSLYGGLAWFMANLFVDEDCAVPDVIVRRDREVPR